MAGDGNASSRGASGGGVDSGGTSNGSAGYELLIERVLMVDCWCIIGELLVVGHWYWQGCLRKVKVNNKELIVKKTVLFYDFSL